MTESDRMTEAAPRPLGRRTPSLSREEALWQAPSVGSDLLNAVDLPEPVPQSFQPVMLSEGGEGPGPVPATTTANGAGAGAGANDSNVEAIEADWTMPDRSTLDPTSAAHRVAFRLIGVLTPAQQVVSELPPELASIHVGSTTPEDVDAVGAAVAGALEWHATEAAGRRRTEDPHFEHRVRLVRELKRWSVPDRAVLALRFLAEWSVDQIALVTGSAEAAVRDITRWWASTEGGGEDGLLHTLAQWTETAEDPSGGAFAPPGHLAHLDDLYEARPGT